jgi:hydroxyacylglutathione hydrolase
MKIQSIKAFSDNYIWLVSTNEGNLVIDPGDSQPVIDFLSQKNITLTDILLTHHHYDHVGGVAGLKKNMLGHVYGPNNPQIEGVNNYLIDGNVFTSCGINFEVIEIPGHTLDHIAYFINDQKQPVLFCGDTLFSAGCGRVFEGTYDQMYESLLKLRKLPENTLVYCGHEYTLNNLKFAEAVEPNNQAILSYIAACEEKLKNLQTTLPSNIKLELQINPFMRCDNMDLRQAIAKKFDGYENITDSRIFEYLRVWKDSF